MGDTSVATVNRHYFKIQRELTRERVLTRVKDDAMPQHRAGVPHRDISSPTQP